MEQIVDQTRARLERVNEETLELKHELMKTRNENVVLKCQLKQELKKNETLGKGFLVAFFKPFAKIRLFFIQS